MIKTQTKKHALILGTLAGQAEGMEWLKEHNWKVSACGHVQEGPGVYIADKFYLVDILDVNKVAELARDIKADVIYSIGSDLAMPTVARVSKELNLPHFYSPETTNILHRKVLTRKFLNSNNISKVRYKCLKTAEDLADFDVFPAILKPADSQGQRGVFVVRSVEDAADLLPQSLGMSKSGEAIIEELIDGPEISVHIFVIDGEIKFFLPSDRHTWEGEAVGIPTSHVIPSNFMGANTLVKVREIVESSVKELGIIDGPLYFQMKLTSGYEPKIIEIAPRLDGCHMWRMIQYYTGLNLIAACFQRLMGMTWSHPIAFDTSTSYSLVFFLQKTGEIFNKDLHQVPANVNCVYQSFFYDDGNTVRSTNGVMEKVGYYILKYS